MPTDEWERGYSAGYRAGWNEAADVSDFAREKGRRFTPNPPKSPKPKRKASAYSKRYGAAFRKVASRFKKKNGSWKTNGFKNAQKAAHKLAKK
jgi:hypothetical protein